MMIPSFISIPTGGSGDAGTACSVALPNTRAKGEKKKGQERSLIWSCGRIGLICRKVLRSPLWCRFYRTMKHLESNILGLLVSFLWHNVSKRQSTTPVTWTATMAQEKTVFPEHPSRGHQLCQMVAKTANWISPRVTQSTLRTYSHGQVVLESFESLWLHPSRHHQAVAQKKKSMWDSWVQLPVGVTLSRFLPLTNRARGTASHHQDMIYEDVTAVAY